LREIKNRGHIIGNHSYNHPRHKPKLKEYINEVYSCQETIQSIANVAATLFRPIRGEITVGSTLAARKLKLKQMLWSIEGGEWGFAKEASAEEIGYRLADEVKSGDIVLLHDNNPKVPAILEIVLPVLITKGFDLSSAVKYY
jgi:peptidoglycan/xylan/chitin deacetylase (PgdA/CDA1 family)